MRQLIVHVCLSIFVLFLLQNCTSVGIIAGGLVDRHHHMADVLDSLQTLNKGDSLHVYTQSGKIDGILISYTGNETRIRQNSDTIKIMLRDIKSLNTYQKSYRWTGILTATGIAIDGFLITILIGLGNMH